MPRTAFPFLLTLVILLSACSPAQLVQPAAAAGPRPNWPDPTLEPNRYPLSASSAPSSEPATKPDPPAVPLLSAPAHGALLTGQSVTFSWQASPGAETYKLEYAGPVSGDTGWIDATSYSFAIPSDGAYSWRVQARNAAGDSDWSPVRSVTLHAPPADIQIDVRGDGFSASQGDTGWLTVASQGAVICSLSGADNLLFIRTNEADALIHWARWTPDIPLNGSYTVYVYLPEYTHEQAVTRSARYLVTHANGAAAVRVDQNVNRCGWTSLGTFSFTRGQAGSIYIDSRTEDGEVTLLAVDAVKFVWIP